MLEKDIEKRAVKAAQAAGWRSYKFSSPAHRGVPDRIFIRAGRVVFIEFKRKGGRVSKLQEREINTMREYGAEVHVCWSIEDAAAVLQQEAG